MISTFENKNYKHSMHKIINTVKNRHMYGNFNNES